MRTIQIQLKVISTHFWHIFTLFNVQSYYIYHTYVYLGTICTKICEIYLELCYVVHRQTSVIPEVIQQINFSKPLCSYQIVLGLHISFGSCSSWLLLTLDFSFCSFSHFFNFLFFIFRITKLC